MEHSSVSLAASFPDQDLISGSLHKCIPYILMHELVYPDLYNGEVVKLASHP